MQHLNETWVAWEVSSYFECVHLKSPVAQRSNIHRGVKNKNRKGCTGWQVHSTFSSIIKSSHGSTWSEKVYLLLVETHVEDRSAGLSNLHLTAVDWGQAPPLAGHWRHRWWVVLLSSMMAVPIWRREKKKHPSKSYINIQKQMGLWDPSVKVRLKISYQINRS